MPLSARSNKNEKFPKVLLYSGWNTRNIGDQGHTPGTLRFLEINFPEAIVTVWLSSTNDEINDLLMARFPKITIVRGEMDNEGKTDSPDLQKAFDEAGLLIHNSGMSYNSFWKPPAILEACIRKNKLICIYGQSFDGFQEDDKSKMAGELSKAMAIYCRDNESYYYLRKIGVNPPILEFGPDGCSGIDLLNDQKAKVYLDKHSLSPKKFISVIIRTNTPAGEKPKNLPKWDVGNTSQNPGNPSSKDAIQTEIWNE